MALTTTIAGIEAMVGVNSPTSSQSAVIQLVAEYAESTIKRIRLQEPTDEIEAQYQPIAIQIGAFLYNKQGMEGAKEFVENGASVYFENGSIPPSMLSQITPKVKVG